MCFLLSRKFHEAKYKNQASVVLWGTGRQNEIPHADDLADACYFHEEYNEPGW
jgi:hypothetical protein